MNVIMERYPYRYVEVGTLDNGKPDFRIQKKIITLRGIEICTFVIMECN